MLLSFHIENYKSILNLTIPLSYAEKKAPNGYKLMDSYPFLEEKDYRCVPILAFYGANASGKSNIINAFSLLTKIIKRKYCSDYYNPNKLHSTNTPMLFKLDFLKEGNELSYTLEVNGKEIIYENLIKDDEIIFTIDNRKLVLNNLATDAYPIEKIESIFGVECLDQDRAFCTSFLSVIGRNYSGLNEYITKAFIYLTRDIEVYSLVNLPFYYGLNKLSKTNRVEDLNMAFSQVVSILKKLDIDISRMELKRNELDGLNKIHIKENHEYVSNPKTKTFTELEINTYHKDIHGNEVQFDFSEESTGTQRAACLLGLILSVLQKGQTFVIDELGNSLHPFLLVEIVRLFKDKRYNKNNAQLIFTTHDTDIMDDDMIRVSELCIVKKSLKRGTEVKRLSDFKGIRNVTSFRKQYLEGNFSGIPHAYI
jgi:AAA15 family ATPase/GTPase